MTITTSDRGFQRLLHDGYPAERTKGVHRLAGQSSAIGDYPDSFDRPGSSYLWIGDNHHLHREEVRAFIGHLQTWLDTGKL